jgi:hypothetical protein
MVPVPGGCIMVGTPRGRLLFGFVEVVATFAVMGPLRGVPR